MGEGAWIVSAFKQESTAYDDQETAERVAKAAGGVAWWCSDVAQDVTFVPAGENEGGVALGPTETKRSPQIAAEGVAKAVERAMGHLGLRSGEIA